jgi:hypothetical protein
MDNHLHIITLLYRFENFQRLKSSIPKKENITWHLVISSQRVIPIYLEKLNCSNIKVHKVQCEDSDFVTKRNHIFSQINHGYFFMLDDDTIFLKKCYTEFKILVKEDFKGMLVAFQKDFFKIRKPKLPYSNPKTNGLDTGSVICHHSVLKHIKWEWTNNLHRDYNFWANCSKYFGIEKIKSSQSIISYWNYLDRDSNQYLVSKKIFNKKIQFKLTNRTTYRFYYLLARIKQFLKQKPRNILSFFRK